MLGPRHPWRGTLSSSDRVPSALSFFIAARFTLLQDWQQSKGRLLSAFFIFKRWLFNPFSLRFLQGFNAAGVLPVAAHRADCYGTADLRRSVDIVALPVNALVQTVLQRNAG